MAEKKIKGRKRHIVTDTQGNLLHVQVHAANIHDTIAGVGVLQATFDKYPSIRGASADAGYRGTTESYVNGVGKLFQVSKKIVSGWVVLAKRWIVERTLAWFNGSRRLSKDYEISVKSAENFIRIAHMFTLLQRLV
jgi:putative transposase